MTERKNIPDRNSQKGAALIIVLLLVATLSVVAVGLTERTVLSASRARNEFTRTQSLWRAAGAEVLASELIRTALLARPGVMSLDDPWALQPFDLGQLATLPGEEGSIEFTDATRCFNVNSLFVPSGTIAAVGANGEPVPDPIESIIEEFSTILGIVGISQNEARQLSVVIGDWIDPDGNTGSGGAEDNAYLRLPVPYRVGNGLIADTSELRAMIGVSKEVMSAIEPFLCARQSYEPQIVNVNMLRPQHAPLLVGIFGDSLTLSDAALIIERRPVGGYENIDEVLNLPFILSLELTQGQIGNINARLDVRSEYLQARMELKIGKTLLQSTMLFKVASDNSLALMSRRFGS